jgi:hypothetical protein
MQNRGVPDRAFIPDLVPLRKKQHSPKATPPNMNRPAQSTYIVSRLAGQYETPIVERLALWLTPLQTDTTYVFAWDGTTLRDEVSPLPSPTPVTLPGYPYAHQILEAKENTLLWLPWQTDT